MSDSYEDASSRLRWESNEQGIDFLVERGRLDRVAPQPQTAEHLLTEARRHVVSAQALTDTEDTSMAFVAAYDAARKALSAILVIQGIRGKGGDGSTGCVSCAITASIQISTRRRSRATMFGRRASPQMPLWISPSASSWSSGRSRAKPSRDYQARVNGSGLRMRMSSSSGKTMYGRLNARNTPGCGVAWPGPPKNSTPKIGMPVIAMIIVA